MRRWIARRRRAARGFGLPEALVGMLIAAGALAAFYDTVSTGLQLRQRTDTRAALALQAFQLLDGIGDAIPLRDGTDFTGRDGTMAWRVVITSRPPQGVIIGPLVDPSVLHIYVSVAPEGQPERAYMTYAARYRGAPL